MVRGDLERIRLAQSLLDQFEQIWRSRIDRLDALLADGDPIPNNDPIPN
jgi:hypothetical protein